MIGRLCKEGNWHRSAIGSALIALLGLGLAGCESVLFATLSAAGRSSQVESRLDIIFDQDHKLALDVYRPRNAPASTPVVLFFYGGRWEIGTRQEYRYVGEALAKRGVLAIVADYRKYPQVRFPDFVYDAAKAFAWTKAHAGEFAGDSQRVFLMGHSAGAHIAALLATDARFLAAENLQSCDIAGVIGIAGPYDFLPLTDADLIDMFGHDPVQQRVSQPVNFVDGHEPPFLLLHGERDTTVKPENSRRLAVRLAAAGVPVQLKMYPGIGHSKILLSLSPALTGFAPALADAIAFVRAGDSSAARGCRGPQ